MKKSIHTEYGKIEYTLQRKNMKNMRLKVDKGRVVVSCAKNIQLKYIDEFVLKHIRWIIETQKKILQKRKGVVPENFESGEAFHFLGQTYTLFVIPAKKENTVFSGGQLIIYIKDNILEKKKKLFFNWLLKQAKDIIAERYCSLYPQFQRQIQKMPDLFFRKMKARWGSANIQKNVVTLNSMLIMAPIACIDYVVVHELAHFIHANHSKDFYGVVQEHIPDWKERRTLLNKQYSLDL